MTTKLLAQSFAAVLFALAAAAASCSCTNTGTTAAKPGWTNWLRRS